MDIDLLDGSKQGSENRGVNVCWKEAEGCLEDS